jgi:S-DNA-T family DNA segregation ATPase FtsK/SpoIIIE
MGDFEQIGRVITNGLTSFFKLAFNGLENSPELKTLFKRTGTFTRSDEGNIVLPSIKSDTKTATGRKVVLTLPCGMKPSQIETLEEELAYNFNSHVVFDRCGKEIIIYLNNSSLPSLIEYTPHELTGTIPFYLGETITVEMTLDLPSLPHMLIGGETGSGKTKLIQLILTQLIPNSLVELYVCDFGKTDLSFTSQYGATFVSSDQGLFSIIDELHQELFSRLDFLQNKGFENILSLNKEETYLKHKVLVIDELAVFRPKSGMEKEEKARLLQAFGKLEDIAGVGRKAGIHLILGTQFPNKDVIPPLLRENLPCRICFKTTSIYGSQAVIGTTAAKYLPKVKGRCIVQHEGDKETQIALIEKESIYRELIPCLLPQKDSSPCFKVGGEV